MAATGWSGLEGGFEEQAYTLMPFQAEARPPNPPMCPMFGPFNIRKSAADWLHESTGIQGLEGL